MRRAVLLAFCMLALFLLSCITPVKPVHAQAAGGLHDYNYETSNPPTIDGKWTTSSEWTDGHRENVGANAIFYDVWPGDLINPSAVPVNYYLLVETVQGTASSGDFWQICFDSDNDVGSAPGPDDFAVNITAHATVTWYQGTGSGWTAISTPPSSTFQWANSLNTSPVYPNQHWILEMMVQKTAQATQCQDTGKVSGPEE